MSFRRLVVYNTIIQIIGKALGAAISLATVIFLTRYLGTAGFGQYSTALAFVGCFVIIADLGIYTITVKEFAQKNKQRQKILGNVFIYRLFSALVIFVVAFLISLLMPYEPIVKLAIAIVSLQSIFAILSAFWGTVFQVNYRMDIPTFVDIFARLLFFISIFLAIHFKLNLLGIFWLLLVSTFLNFLLVYLLGLKFIKPRLRLDWRFWRYFIKESWPVGLATVLGMISFQIGTILLSIYKPMSDVGIYSSAYRVFENLIFIPIIFVNLIFPKLSELYRKDFNQLKNIFQKTFDILLTTVFPFAIFFFFLAPHCIYIVAGEDFIAAHYPLKILVLVLILVFLYYPLTQLLVAAGKQKWLVSVSALSITLAIVLNLIFIHHYSYNGVAFVVLASAIIIFLSLLALNYYLIKFMPSFLLLKKLILPSLIMGIFLYLLLSTSFFSLEKFAQFGIIKQAGLVFIAFLLAGSCYLLILLALKIVPFNFLRGLLYKERS